MIQWKCLVLHLNLVNYVQYRRLMNNKEAQKQGNELKLFFIASVALLYLVAFLIDSPGEIAWGMKKIILSRNALITDYFELAGMGAAFLNSAIVTTICLMLILVSKIPFTGPTMAALYINIGYGFWGKNPLSILPILLGTFLYAKLHHMHFGRFIYTALFGTCLAPFVTEMVYLLPFSLPCNLMLAVIIGVFIGFVMPPLSAHTASMHLGYNLFNVGFSAGILAFVMFCTFRAFGLESETVLIWQEGSPMWLVIGVYVYFAIAIIMGFFLNGKKTKELWHLFRRPGRAVTDFVLMDGEGAALMNMGLSGMIGLTYIIVIRGDLSGPVLGAVFIVFGFSAFGAHVKNYPPVLAGVLLFSIISQHSPTTPGMQLAALFAVGLAPLAGQFGVFVGILSGMLHAAIVMCTADMYGGLNLYNNGFSAGWVAIFMVPTVESFMRHFEDRKRRKSKNKEDKIKKEQGKIANQEQGV